MRALALIPVGLLVSVLALAACTGDQQATTAPSTTPSFFVSRKSYTFSLSCSNAGTSTVAQVTVIISPTVSGRLAPLGCGGQESVSAFKSFDYLITLTDPSDTPVAVCDNTKPIRNPGSITCQNAGGTSSATLTVS